MRNLSSPRRLLCVALVTVAFLFAAGCEQWQVDAVTRYHQSQESSRRQRQLTPFLVCIRHHESDRGAYPNIGGYGAQNSHSTASGAYQFLDGTWRNSSRDAGYGGYARAKYAPWYVQDAVAYRLYTSGGRSAWAGSGC